MLPIESNRLQLPFPPLKNSIFDFASRSTLKNFSFIFPNETGLFTYSQKYFRFFF